MKRLVVLALLVMSACRTPAADPEEPTVVDSSDEYEVKSAAEHDLDCFRDEIEVGTTDDADVYTAVGCGRSGRYKVSCTSTTSSTTGSSDESCTASAVEEESDVEGED